jgi:hypothetical protein
LSKRRGAMAGYLDGPILTVRQVTNNKAAGFPPLASADDQVWNASRLRVGPAMSSL